MNFDDLNQIPWDETTRPAPEVVAQVRDWIKNNCPNCNPNAKAIKHAQAQWVVAGVDKGE